MAQALDRLAHELGALGVEIGRRLVEDDERRVAEEGAREGDPPPLARRERAPAVADHGVVPVRQAEHERVGAGELGSLPDPLVGRRGVAEPDVVGDAAAEERRALRQPGDAPPPGIRAARAEIDTADGDSAGRRAPPGAGGDVATVLLPDPLAPTSATVSPGKSSRSSPSRTRPGRDGYEKETPSKPDRQRSPGSAVSGARRTERNRAPRARARIRSATARPSALAWNCVAELTERQVKLGREHEHGQRRPAGRARRPPGARRP